MTTIRAWMTHSLTTSKAGKAASFLILILFALVPFQRRFHGFLDSFSRKLTLPDFPLPEYFSTKVHLFPSDLMILALTLVALFVFKGKLRDFFWKGPSKYLTLLFFAALASLTFSPTSHYVLQYLRLLQFSMMFLLFNAIYSAQSQIDFPAFIKKLAWVLVSVACLECAISVYQYFCQHSLGLKFLGEANIQKFPFDNPGSHRWVFDKLFNSSAFVPYLCRAAGTFSHPNVLGGFLFCSLLASYYLWMKEEDVKRRLFVLGAILLQIFTLYTAYSRSAMLALALSTFIWCILQIRRGLKTQKKRFASLAVLIAVGTLIGIATFYSQLTARGGIFNYNTVTQHADSERIQYLKMAIGMIQDHPFLGVGFNNFQLAYEPVQAGFPSHIFFSKVHNIYLLLGAETGLIGGGLFLMFLFVILKSAWRAIFSSFSADGFQEKVFLFTVFIGLLCIGLFDFYLIDTQHGRLLFFGFAGLLCAATVSKPEQQGTRHYKKF